MRKKTKTRKKKWPTVCSVASAKKLVEAGAPQLTKYYWTLTHFKPGVMITPADFLEKPIWTLRHYNQKLENDLIRISAYTFEELVELYLRKVNHTKKP